MLLTLLNSMHYSETNGSSGAFGIVFLILYNLYEEY